MVNTDELAAMLADIPRPTLERCMEIALSRCAVKKNRRPHAEKLLHVFIGVMSEVRDTWETV